MANQTEAFKKQYISIPEFYSGKHIFITGGTGYIGKLLVEKLLRSCPEIGNIYLLARSKKGINANERLNDMLNSKIFDNVRQNSPTDLNKVKTLSGDLVSSKLGISLEDKNILLNNVSIVIHLAATIRFNGPLKTAVEINMIGTKKVIELCHEIKDLKAFVHVSTAYSNCYSLQINEQIYSQIYSANDIIGISNLLPENILNKITSVLLNNKPNTYTFTKALAEEIVQNEAHNLPSTIVRPSIVGGCYKEPLPGWVDNFGGPVRYMCAIGNGTMRAVRINENYYTDIIPIDFVVNTIIAAGWNVSIDTNITYKLPIYNCTSSNQNPNTLKNLFNSIKMSMRKNPFEDVIWYIFLIHCNYNITYKCIKYVLQYIPAVIIDLLLKCIGKTPIMKKTENSLTKLTDIFYYYASHQWNFDDKNVRHLLCKMSDEDRKIFEIDTKVIDWDEYIENYCLGVRNYLLKHNESSTVKCRKQMKKLLYYHQILLVFVVAMFCYIFVKSF